MEQFRKGDRVVYLGDSPRLQGKLATLIDVESCLIEFDEPWSSTLHDGNGRGKPNHCWWTGFGCLQKIESLIERPVAIPSSNLNSLL